MTTFEDRTRSAVCALADHAPAPPPVVGDGAYERGLGTSGRPVRVAVAVTCAAALAAAAIWVGPGLLRRPTVSVSTGASPPPQVQALPPGPLLARTLEVSAWTGREWLLWGGIENDDVQPDDGAAYDPAHRRWRVLPSAPLAGRQGAVSVWTGAQWLIWGGSAASRPFHDGASYDPATNRWDLLPTAPASLADAADLDPEAVWTGNEMLVAVDGGAAAYWPATRTWRTLAAPPGQVDGSTFGSSGTAAVWTGTEMLLRTGYPATVQSSSPASATSTSTATPPPATSSAPDPSALPAAPSLDTTAAGYHLVDYDPRRDRWTVLPAGGFDGDIDPMLAWTGTTLLSVDLGAVEPDGQRRSSIASYDPATAAWSPVPLPAGGVALDGTATWVGTSLVVWDGGPAAGSYSPSTRVWSTVGGPPAPALEAPAAVWTGRTLLTWGGLTIDLDGPGPPFGLAAGSSYTPPRP